MPRRPHAWMAILAAAALFFAGAVALTVMGLGNTPTGPQVTPTPPTVVQGSPSFPGVTGNPGSSNPQVTPSPEPTPLSNDKQIADHSVGPNQLTGYGWPLKRSWITSQFAPRDFGTFIIIDGVGYHDGLDLATHCGDKVYATHDGAVLVADRTFNNYLGYWGHPEDIYNREERLGRVNNLAIAVVIDDGNGYRSQYMHLKEATVVPGQYVHRGDQIGVEGETGAATGCHVHYSLIRMDGLWQEIIPRLWKYGYPEKIREHVDPKDVLPWGDEWAPLRLYYQVHPSPSPTAPPPGTPTSAPTPSPTASPSPTPTH